MPRQKPAGKRRIEGLLPNRPFKKHVQRIHVSAVSPLFQEHHARKSFSNVRICDKLRRCPGGQGLKAIWGEKYSGALLVTIFALALRRII